MVRKDFACWWTQELSGWERKRHRETTTQKRKWDRDWDDVVATTQGTPAASACANRGTSQCPWRELAQVTPLSLQGCQFQMRNLQNCEKKQIFVVFSYYICFNLLQWPTRNGHIGTLWKVHNLQILEAKKTWSTSQSLAHKALTGSIHSWVILNLKWSHLPTLLAFFYGIKA